ncbi:STAS domain-containing protein [Actinoplanes sp. N902-109]|uniref:STAS domain-containing protein n=1 Tax=Actinoplanes sp. (strain N902-109) TaxID=649831 RepID=UPI00032940A0|nr:STAS domain-containing protein [Actinoplanes sp. N902-109]AGL18913.1 hypothetical protein L083_5403 [Actinoplanes sp. N902-109]
MPRPLPTWIEGPPGEFSASVTGYDGTWLATVSRRAAGTATPAAVVTVEGDVDLDTAPLLQAGLLRALQSWPFVVCDLNKVTFFGAAGTTALLAARRCASATGHTLSLRGARGMTRQILEMFDLANLIMDD